MKQLSNQDAGFIYHETPSTPMHVAGLGIYNQPEGKPRPNFDSIIEIISSQLPLAPFLRYQYTPVPFGLDKPYWVSQKDFDLTHHVRHIALAKPGNWDQLMAAVADLHAEPLDFDKPLWEATIIEGLNQIDGLNQHSFAIFVKVHHALADGASGQALFSVFNSESVENPPPAEEPAIVDRPPTKIELFSRSIPNLFKRPVDHYKSLTRNTPKLFSKAIELYKGEINTGSQLLVPPTPFNEPVSPERITDCLSFPFARIEAIKQSMNDVTINDVMMTVISEGLRRYLSELEVMPEASLCAMMPQNVRTQGNDNSSGNQVGGFFSSLHTDIEDPQERLMAISSSTKKAKAFSESLDITSLIQNYLGGFLSQGVGKTFNQFLHSQGLLKQAKQFLANTLITNVAGPKEQLYHLGAPLNQYYTFAPLSHCLGLNHAIFSYKERITLSLVADRALISSLDDYKAYLIDALNNLESTMVKSKPDTNTGKQVVHSIPKGRTRKKQKGSQEDHKSPENDQLDAKSA